MRRREPKDGADSRLRQANPCYRPRASADFPGSIEIVEGCDLLSSSCVTPSATAWINKEPRRPTLLHGSAAGRGQPPASTFMRGECTPAAQAPACGSVR